MLEFQAFVQEHYPELATNIDPAVKFELVGGGNLSMLITWEGADPSLLPVIINCHYDVVPTDQTRAATSWDHGVYSGYIDRKKDRIYGRGTADNKGQCIGNLEAATVLYKSGWKPKRSLLFLFNHDEESSGFRGNNSFAEVLPKEEMDVVRKQGNELDQADALINLALGTTTIDELRNGTKSRAYQTWARTKRSMTLLSSSTSENTLPQVATLTWNFRSLWPWVVEGNDTNPGMIKFFEGVLASMNDTQLGAPGGYNVTFQPTNRGYGFDPQLGTTTNTSNWNLLKKTVQSVLSQDGQPLPVVATLMVGGTDSKLMQGYAKQGALRMMPYALTALDAKRIHGDNEQISISNWRSARCLSHELIKAYGEMP
jgi:acetylornithine deacetylase/succinyl-diaminopimelate desuccinylase-like protein